MLPKELIKLTSLTTSKESLTLSVGVNISTSGEIDSYIISRALIRTDYNLTYNEADELIDYCPQ